MSERSFIARGAASFRVDFDGPPRDFYFLLLPRLTMLAFSSAVEPLRVANQVANRELYRWFVMTEDGAPVRCSNGILITPDSGLLNLPKSASAFICSGTEPSGSISQKAVAWASRQRAFGCQVGGICTGGLCAGQGRAAGSARFHPALGEPTRLHRKLCRSGADRKPL